jgi:hypothetical protein
MKLEDAWNVDASTAKTCVSSYSSGLGRIFQPIVCRLEFILDLAQKVSNPRLEWRQLTLTNSCYFDFRRALTRTSSLLRIGKELKIEVKITSSKGKVGPSLLISTRTTHPFFSWCGRGCRTALNAQYNSAKQAQLITYQSLRTQTPSRRYHCP